MGRTAATPDSTAATVEQQQFDLLFPTDFHQPLLSPILRPGRRRGTGVLGRVGVADHHLLRALQTRAITGQQQQALHDRAGVIQVGQGLEQRHHAHRPQDPGLLEQQLHRKHIGGRARHGDHIGAQRCRRCRRDLLAGRQHFGGVHRGLEVRRQQRSTVGQLTREECQARLFIPVFIAPQP